MKLSEILKSMEVVSAPDNPDMEITAIENDSRQVKQGALFVAVRGYETDGHLYCNQAIKQGAAAIIVEDEEGIQIQDGRTAVIKVKNSRIALAQAATAFYGEPSRNMNMVGITGTNGKTSTALLSYRILQETGHPSGLIGTISNFINEREIPAERTTPEAHELQALFAEMAEEKLENVLMEVSSHALDLNRVEGIAFKVAVFTNLSLDHLDFHKTMENYLHAKSKLFQMAEIGVVNADDAAHVELLKHHTCKQIAYYSIKDSNADFYASNIHHEITGAKYELHFQGKIYPVSLQTPGNFSVYNSLAAIAATYSLGLSIPEILQALSQNSKVRGRFQSIVLPKDFTAVVDYAHTPDGLENVLKSVLEFKKGRCITVFGCGGDRDRSKRPQMAAIAEKYSDYVIITSDNPRTENPEDIVKEVAGGMKGNAYEIEVDRKKAIHKALAFAEKNDVVLIAGKGHEDYQIIGKEKIHFDDVEIVEDWGRNQLW